MTFSKQEQCEKLDSQNIETYWFSASIITPLNTELVAMAIITPLNTELVATAIFFFHFI